MLGKNILLVIYYEIQKGTNGYVLSKIAKEPWIHGA